MQARAENTDSNPWFNVSVPYAYWATNNLLFPPPHSAMGQSLQQSMTHAEMGILF
ncbi:MAG: hypothetical protein ACBZ72_12635 [Candidatus Bathyarchaeia archaeon]